MRAALGLGITALLVHGFLFWVFWAGTLFGTVASRPILDARTWNTTAKGRTTAHYGVVVSLGELSGPFVMEVSRDAYLEASAARKRDEEPTMPFVLLPDGDDAVVGDRPTLVAASCATSWLIALVAPFIYVLRIRHVRPWYERPKVVDEGAGPLGNKDELQ
jgi:hypothetical protein